MRVPPLAPPDDQNAPRLRVQVANRRAKLGAAARGALAGKHRGDRAGGLGMRPESSPGVLRIRVSLGVVVRPESPAQLAREQLAEAAVVVDDQKNGPAERAADPTGWVWASETVILAAWTRRR